jgi:TPR repeat protein
MLGTTFDPLVIQQLGAIGVVPDVAQARQWYEKAVELGSDAASGDNFPWHKARRFYPAA